jgi:U3 small nucleolar RNA-associated protein 5
MEEEFGTAEPSLGELIAAKGQKSIFIAESFPPTETGALIPEAVRPVAIPSGISLATVLTQALRTNDDHLLESCLQNSDTQIIRSTIQRMDSSLAGTLMLKLAERLSSRPGRYGNLLVWVQWVCVAHGGAIGSNPAVSSKIKTLYTVLNQRSKSLDSLLLLKGKLDMLDAQLSLRKQLLVDRGSHHDPDDSHVVYVEDQDHDASSAEDDHEEALANGIQSAVPSGSKGLSASRTSGQDYQDGLEDDVDMPMANGVVDHHDSDFDSDEHNDSFHQPSGMNLIDDEAEESDEASQASEQEDEESDEDLSEEEGDGDNDQDSEMAEFIDDDSIEETNLASDVSIEQPPSKALKRK